MIPIYGKLSDLFGRKSIFLIGVVLFLTGSALSGVSQSMNQLIIFRAIQGLGAAALMPIAMAVIGDLFTPRERGRWQGATGAVFGLASVLGPAVGGWITDNVSWRWVFYVNLPIGIIALLVLVFLMPNLSSNKGGKVRIDYAGVLMLVAATVPLMLAFTWAGSTYAWASVQIIGLIGGSVLVYALFFVYEAWLERREGQPIIAPSLFQNPIVSISIAVTMCISMSMFGCIYFLPLFAQGVLGISASNSGFLLTPMMLSLIVGSVSSGQLVSRFGRYKWIAIMGAMITIVGTALLLRLGVDSTSNELWTSMVVLGLGLGFGMSIYTVVVQNAVERTKIGQVTSALTFFRQIGATIALSAMGSILTTAYQPGFTNALTSQVKQFVSVLKQTRHVDILSYFSDPNILLSSSAQAQMTKLFGQMPGGMSIYAQLLDAVKVGLAQGVHNTFITSLIIVCVGFVLVFFLKEIPLRGKGPQKPVEVVEESFEEVGEEFSAASFH
jgi:EmrB/QacA subfamily drug resistance transporter